MSTTSKPRDKLVAFAFSGRAFPVQLFTLWTREGIRSLPTSVVTSLVNDGISQNSTSIEQSLWANVSNELPKADAANRLFASLKRHPE